jgi:hypothetical protein
MAAIDFERLRARMWAEALVEPRACVVRAG